MLQGIISEYLNTLRPETWIAAALVLLPGLVSAWLILMTLRRVPASDVGSRYLFFMAFMCVWQVSEGLMRLTSSAEIAGLLNRYVTAGGAFLAAAGLDLALVLTERQRHYQNRLLRLIIYAPSALYSLFFAHGITRNTLVRSEFWGWVSGAVNDLSETVFSYWFAALGLASLACYAFYAREVRQSDMLRKARARWLLAGYLVPVCQGSVTEVIMPYGFHADAIPVTGTFIVIFSVITYLVILRYGLLAFTPDLLRGQLAEHISEGIVIVDNGETFQFGNSRFFAMTGYSRNDLVGRESVLLLLDAEGGKVVLDKSTLRAKGIADSYELRMRRKSGEWMDVSVSGAPFYDSNGKIIGSIAILTDITERRRTETMLSNALLEGRERERKRIAQDMHDGFGQILAAISIHVQTLKIRDDNRETARKLLGLVQSAVREYRAISHNLLPPALEMSGIKTALEELCAAGSSKQVSVTFRASGNLASVTKPVQAELYRIAQEIIANAIAHGKPSGIRVRLVCDSRQLTMEVTDNGVGFDTGKDRSSNGNGYRNMAARVSFLRGEMDIRSAPGKGTCVTVKIPVTGTDCGDGIPR